MAAYALSSKTKSELADNVNGALALHKEGNLDEALRAYDEVVKEVPATLQITLFSNMGAIFSAKGDYEAAADAFRSAILASDGTNNLAATAQAHFNLAVTYTSKLNKHEEAFDHCSIALRMSPTLQKALHLMGNILQSMGKPEEGENYFVMAESMAASGISSNRAGNGDPRGKIDWSHVQSKSNLGDISSTMLDGKTYEMECISERPLIFRILNLLSPEECEELAALASPLLEKSFVMGGQVETSSPDVSNAYRTSQNAWLSANNNITFNLQKRISGLLGISRELLQSKLEELQVVRYAENEQFKVHHDSSSFHVRIMTVLLYMNSVKRGGETYFPFAPSEGSLNDAFDYKVKQESIQEGLLKLEQNGEGLKISPIGGSGLIFANHILDDLRIDSSAVHAGLPVLNSEENIEECHEGSIMKPGSKWVCNYWIDA